jgi:hypothetical protein
MFASVLSFLSTPWVWVGGLSLAAFLVLFWTLRGAPVGQDVQEETVGEVPRAGYRDRVVAASVAGFLLVAVGAYVAMTSSIVESLLLFAVGFGLLIYLASANRRYRHASPILRRVVQFSNMALGTALLGGVLIVGNVLAFKYGGHPIDFTAERAFSLADQTVNLLKGLDRPVKFTVVIGMAEARRRVEQLLELYEKENPGKITVESINPYSDLEKFEDLRKRAPDVAVAVAQGVGIVVEYGVGKSAERVVVNGTELFESPRVRKEEFDPAKFQTDFKGEAAFTSALIRLKEGKKPLIAFITGHGEPPADEITENKQGLGLLRAQITAFGARVVEMNLVYREVPAECELAIIASPRRPFLPVEITRLRAHMARGGRLLAIVGADGRGGLNDWLREYQLEIGATRIVEPRMNAGGRPYTLIEVLGGVRHPIVDSLARQYVCLPNAAPISILPKVQESAVDARPILRTTVESWAETDLSGARPQRDPKDPRGPLNLGVAVTVADTVSDPAGGRSNTPRMVVFGSPDMADNLWLSRFPANLDLVMNSVHWLRGRTQLVGIAPKTHVAQALVATDQQRAGLVWIPTFSAMFFIIGLGAIAYFSRRM